METEISNQWVKEQLERVPDKLSFRIGEVAKILDVKPYILRYWESEFEQLKPSKLDNKQRLYFHKDIETLFLIKKLLYRDGFSIRGAKQALKPLKKELKKDQSSDKVRKRLEQEIDFLVQKVDTLRQNIS